jgi:hypothetical protein
MTQVADKVRQGKRNRTAGLNWNRACVVFLRTIGWPAAERQLFEHRSDIGGIGDIAVETTIEPWSQIWVKMAQAEGDARRRGLDAWCVWKKHNRRDDGKELGAVNPGKALVIFPAEIIWPLLFRLEQLEASAAGKEHES